MSSPTSRLAYEPHYELLDRALASENGIRAKYPDYGTACRMRLEMYSARRVDRDENKQMYWQQKDHPMFGKSIYDSLRCSIDIPKGHNDPCWLIIRKMNIGTDVVEELEA